jgi:Tfp pilus assembly protein PilN
MRPIDLIPSDQRQGARAPMRTGPIPYIVIGALVAVLAGVTLLVVTGDQVAERKNEVAQLKRENAAARAQAKRLKPYVQFQALHEQRLATISSLANSRFDWERVMRELALILPHDVWLTELTATASPEAGAGGGGSLRSGAAGPALELEGCAVGQEAVAGFVTTLKEIDGVTRVGVESSELSKAAEGAASSEDQGSGGGCQTRRFIAKFSIVVAFDAAPIPLTAQGEEEALASATETAESSSEAGSESGGTPNESEAGEGE